MKKFLAVAWLTGLSGALITLVAVYLMKLSITVSTEVKIAIFSMVVVSVASYLTLWAYKTVMGVENE